MARKPRLHFPGAIYHVIARGNRKQAASGSGMGNAIKKAQGSSLRF
jgi:hypothetical protein